MNIVPFINIHTHHDRLETETIIVQNIFPGNGFAAFTGRNYYSVGLHPWFLKSQEENNKMLHMVKDALKFDHVCFVGECGLDKKVNVDFEEQMRVFRVQAFIAEEYKRPMIIHCVKAYNEVLELHRKLHPEMPWIMHGYRGSVQTTQLLGKHGIFFSFGKSLFDENSKSIESLKCLPMEKIFFETDEFEGSVEQIYERAAFLKNVSPGILKIEAWNNFNRIESSLISRF
ncbi:MAG: TatD DNase family [Prolixibacteraceae bacterium]|nr:MAG: TatD DNase family [Prolixibacteraceae bacterium]